MTKALCLYNPVLKVPLKDCTFSPQSQEKPRIKQTAVSTSAMLASYKLHLRKNFPKTWRWDDLCTVQFLSGHKSTIRSE